MFYKKNPGAESRHVRKIVKGGSLHLNFIVKIMLNHKIFCKKNDELQVMFFVDATH